MYKKTVKAKTGFGSGMDERSLQAKIREKAYELYEKSGRSHGMDRDHWFKAEAIVKNEKGV